MSLFSREPCAAGSCSGASSAFGNVQPESEIMRMLLSLSWKPAALGEQAPQTPEEYFRRINQIIVSVGGVQDGVRE